MSPQVMFVDDDLNCLDGLRRMLHPYQEDWRMTFVGSVEEALSRLNNTPIDTVVSDVQLPGLTGFDLLQAIAASPVWCHVPVIMMTGAGERDLKRRALRLKTYQDQIRGQNDNLERKVHERTKALDAARIDLIWRLGRVAEFRDEQTGNHIMRVGAYCKVLAEALGMPRDFADMIFLTSPLHDIGKIGIPDGILLRPGKLTAAEWDVMRRHCTLGAEILRQDARTWSSLPVAFPVDSTDEPGSRRNPFLEMASSIALAHHEWWDGTGYPRRLSGEAIPVAARIAAVADVYDALSSARPYKAAFPEDVVLSILGKKVGSHFDPAVYEAFCRSLAAFREILGRLTDQADAA